MRDEKRRRQEESWRIAIVDSGVVDRTAQALAYQQVARTADGRNYRDPHLLRMVEVGLVTTYMRAFVGTRVGQQGVAGYSKLSRKSVPQEHRQLHDLIEERRHLYAAHTGVSDPPIRRVEAPAGANWFSVSEPDPLTPAQLLELSELCRKLRDALETRLA